MCFYLYLTLLLLGFFLLLLILFLLGLNYNKKFMNIFILEILSLDCNILLSLNKSIMSMSPITLEGLEIIEIGVLI
jgi:hypothetical protein